MNQPRNGNYPGNNRRSVAHSTGRSNYGGSRGGGGKGNPVGNWIQNRRQQRQKRRRERQSSDGGAVGTEAKAIQNIAQNSKHFAYPAEGFVTPIEHSLLYAMIEFPEQYPESVVKNEIEEEEFDVYFYMNDPKRKGNAVSDGGGGGDISEGGLEENEGEGDQARPGHETTASTHSSPSSLIYEEERVSYAQLSAMAALSAEKSSSTAAPHQSNTSTSTASTNNINSSSTNSANNPAPTSADKSTQLTIGQTLVRKLLKTITRYSDARGLDRQHEISEFMSPIERRCQLRNEKAALQQLLPAYVGYTLSLATGNPLPLLIGAAALTRPDPMMDENQNVSGFRAVGGRAGDMETAGLLDECESD